jgi:glycosyltransferase involved in cell wall biosynthesis
MLKIVAVMVVRNEADLLPINIRYHAAQGIGEFRIVDNGSSDATLDRLRELAPTARIRWTRDDGPYHQSAMATQLAVEAARDGADWIVPIDADEFWSAGRRSLAEALAASPAGAIAAPVLNFVQRRNSHAQGDAALLTMTARVRTSYAYERCRELVESRQIAFVEMDYPAKWIFRASPAVRVHPGAHGVDGVAVVAGPSPEIVCLHAPIRSRAVLDARAEHGRRLIAAGYRWYRLHTEGRLDEEWRANSTEHGYLELGGRRTPLMFDSRLRDAVRPWRRE